jgi:hypothetical protein
MTQNLLTVAAATVQMALPYLLTALVLLGALAAYRTVARRIGQRVLLDAERAMARSRVERRRNAQARNLEFFGVTR